MLTDLYRHAKNILTGHREDDLYLTRQAEFYQQIADTVDDPEISTWLNNASQNLPRNYCEQHEPQFISEQLLQLREVIAEQVQCTVGRVKGRNLIELCIGKRKKRRAGVFYRVTGLLASLGLSITSVDIKPIGDSLIFYWFKCADLDFEHAPQRRLDEIQRRAIAVVAGGDKSPPQFRTKWKKRGGGRALQLSRPIIEVKIDNQTVDSATIIDVFCL